jgi:acylphosphatase
MCYHPPPMNARAHALVSGRVQGVAFRGYTRKWALELGLKGWVRNLYDGRVEAVAEGERSKVETLLSRIKTGPPLSRVENMDVAWEAYRGEFDDFRIAWLDF